MSDTSHKWTSQESKRGLKHSQPTLFDTFSTTSFSYDSGNSMDDMWDISREDVLQYIEALPLTPNKEVNKQDLKYIDILSKEVLASLEHGAPFPACLALQTANIAHLIARVGTAAVSDDVRLWLGTHNDILGIVRTRRLIDEGDRAQWLPSEVWHAIFGITLQLWHLRRQEEREGSGGIKWPEEFVSLVTQDPFDTILSDVKSAAELPPLAKYYMFDADETAIDLVQDTSKNTHVRAGASSMIISRMNFKCPTLLLEVIENNDLLRPLVDNVRRLAPALMPQRHRDEPDAHACTNAYDDKGVVRMILSAFTGLLSGATTTRQQYAAEGKFDEADSYWERWIDVLMNSGIVSLVVRLLQSFKKLEDKKKVHPHISSGPTILTMMAHGRKVSRRILDFTQGRHNTRLCDLLVYAIANDDDALPAINSVTLRISSTMAISKLVGGAEDTSDDDNAVGILVPPPILHTLVDICHKAVNGTSSLNVANLLACLEPLSTSDANTAHLVTCGILAVIAKVLTQTPEDMAHRHRMFQYNVVVSRTYASLILFNLALSDTTLELVRKSPEVMASMESCFKDKTLLTSKIKRHLQGIVARLDSTGKCTLCPSYTMFAPLRSRSGAPPTPSGHDMAGHDSNGLAPTVGGETEVPEFTYDIMLSYSWANQPEVLRVLSALQERKYRVWIDVEQMYGSTVDAMADAVENSRVILYGVSADYKASAACRLEANYAFQLKKRMIPLMLDDGYAPKGWLGLMLGTRLWYGFYGDMLNNAAQFMAKVDSLCRELGPPYVLMQPQDPYQSLRLAPIPARDQGNPTSQSMYQDSVLTPTPQEADEEDRDVDDDGNHAPQSAMSSEDSPPAQTQHDTDDLSKNAEGVDVSPEGKASVSFTSVNQSLLSRRTSSLNAKDKKPNGLKYHKVRSSASLPESVDTSPRSNGSMAAVVSAKTVASHWQGQHHTSSALAKQNIRRHTFSGSTDSTASPPVMVDSGSSTAVLSYDNVTVGLSAEVDSFNERVSKLVANGMLDEAHGDLMHDAVHDTHAFLSSVVALAHSTATDDRRLVRQLLRGPLVDKARHFVQVPGRDGESAATAAKPPGSTSAPGSTGRRKRLPAAVGDAPSDGTRKGKSLPSAPDV
eukprot:m.1214011 g.1214011  ORF g.1214011 m.1214011 type:complete len:1123 (+) comp24603_c0_seq10:257-3625(+)